MAQERIKKFYFPVEEEFSTEPTETSNAVPTQTLYNRVENSGLNNQLYGDDEIETQQVSRMAPPNTIVFNPSQHSDAESITEQIMLGASVIVNLESLLRDDESKEVARRIIDFVCGAAFALNIPVKKINASTFLIAKE